MSSKLDESEVGCQINLVTGEHYGECRGSCKMAKDDDKLPMQATMEQGREGLVQFAKSLGDYFKQLREEGFSRSEAFQIVMDFQRTTFGRVKQ